LREKKMLRRSASSKCKELREASTEMGEGRIAFGTSEKAVTQDQTIIIAIKPIHSVTLAV
jgi:hypothetical protein